MLARQGAYLRGIARRLIRYRSNPNTRSTPGSAPYTHGWKALKLSISFAVAADSSHVLIGPAANWIGDLGALHEFGGMRRTSVVPERYRKNQYKIGEVGPVSTRRYKTAVISRHRKPDSDPLGGHVAWIRIKSARQADHASRLAQRMARSAGETRNAKYPARPFMRPALNIGLERLPYFWRNAIRK